MAEAALETRELCRSFGGLKAVDGVSILVEEGHIHAVIGPNGAGKTTLVNLLAGEINPGAGEILLKGRRVTGFPPQRMARLGLGRCWQRTSLLGDFTCFENCWIGARPSVKPGFELLRLAKADVTTREIAMAALETCGLTRHMNTPAHQMSHGEQRQLELAMTIAGSPDILLLDEPLAGLGPEESLAMTRLLGRLAADHTMVLVEHDMDAVFALADRVTVMVEGRVLASNRPEAIRADATVQEAYLGHPEQNP